MYVGFKQSSSVFSYCPRPTQVPTCKFICTICTTHIMWKVRKVNSRVGTRLAFVQYSTCVIKSNPAPSLWLIQICTNFSWAHVAQTVQGLIKRRLLHCRLLYKWPLHCTWVLVKCGMLIKERWTAGERDDCERRGGCLVHLICIYQLPNGSQLNQIVWKITFWW